MGIGARRGRARRARRARNVQRRNRLRRRRRHIRRGIQISFRGGVRHDLFRSRLSTGFRFFSRPSQRRQVGVGGPVTSGGPGQDDCPRMAWLILFFPFSVALIIAGIVVIFVVDGWMVSYVLFGIGGFFFMFSLLGCCLECFEQVGDFEDDVEGQSRAQSTVSVVSAMTVSQTSYAGSSTSMAMTSMLHQAAYNDQAMAHPQPSATVPYPPGPQPLTVDPAPPPYSQMNSYPTVTSDTYNTYPSVDPMKAMPPPL